MEMMVIDRKGARKRWWCGKHGMLHEWTGCPKCRAKGTRGTSRVGIAGQDYPITMKTLREQGRLA